MWNSGFTNNDFVPVQNPIWLETPKTEQLGFHSVLVWAKRLGDTAKNSYNNVLFWSGRFSAVFDDTPMFWVSYLYKKLIGNGVLDITSNTFIKEDVEVTAYCAKEGAMIVTAANTDHNKFTASIKLAKIYFKKIKVQKYVVTSRNDGFTYLNEKKLSKKMLKTNFAEPDIETIETDGTFNLIVPAKSIIIIVLYDATVPACAFNPNEEKKFGSQIYPKMRKNEIVGNIKTLDDFRQFLIDNKIRTPKRTTKLEIVFAERPHVHNHSPNHTKEIELQLTNDEIKKILLDRAKNSVVETNEKQLEMEMKKAVKKLIKNTKTDHQTLKRLAKDRVRRDAFKRSPKSRDLIAHMAPVTMHGKKGDNSFEEEILKSGEKYVDERVRILTEPDTGNSELEKYRDNYFSENFGNVRIKRENAESNGKVPSEDVLGNIRKWQNRFNRPKKINSDIVSSKRNNKKTDMKLLKEKMENRKKMGDWIKKRHARPKRSLLNRNDVYVPKVRDIKSINPYVSKVLKEKWKPDDLRLIKRKPSYSIENLSQREFLPTLKRKQRKPRNTAEDFDLNDNEIDDESRNKIPKIGYVSSVPTQTSTISTYESVDTSNTSSYAIEEEDKGEHFFNSIVSNIKYFIENIYEKVSSYFTT
ncbi:hypothetical protein FQR65_LT13448 [Abscondita terminalis]|nr:hypothetical protein FQR65_LT13448 [Abscondita terminalis]